MLYDDPIVFLGEPGRSHLHVFFGNTGSNAFSTAESLRSSGNSTCRGGIANRSSYWVPATVDSHGVPLKPIDSDFYYQSGFQLQPEQIGTIPPGLRMIAGNNPKDNDAPRSQHVRYTCSNDPVWIPHENFPDCPAGETVIAVVDFPQCWDGVSLDSANHRSHMAYPQNFRCPASHPHPIPLIAFNIKYVVPAGDNARNWRLSSDTYSASEPGGRSLHGDYFFGWEPEVIDQIVHECASRPVNCKSHLIGREGSTGRYQVIY